MSRLPTKKLNPNEVLFKEGSIGEIAYLVKKGTIEISVEISGEKVVLATLKPPAIFGEMALIFKEETRTATAKATEYTELVQIEKQNFEDYFEKSPPIMVHMVNSLGNRLRKTTEKVGKISDKFMGTVEVLNLLVQHGITEIDYGRVVIALAGALASDTAEISRRIDAMERLDLFEVLLDANNRKTIRIVRHDFLSAAKKIHQTMEAEGIF